MISSKTAAIQKPTALGSLASAATYGMAIPNIYGTVRAALLAIWAQNLRSGKCRGKKYKGKKKSVPNYVESIDFLIGSNPIEGVLQAYLNKGKYSLNFIRLDLGSLASDVSLSPYTFSDPKFYFLLALTAQLQNSGYFNDFGSPNYNGIGAASIVAGGSGYAVNDQFAVNGTTGTQAIGTVTAIGGGGAVTAFTLGSIGSGYSTGSNFTTTTISGAGSGLKVNVSHLGTPYDDTSEYPFWNTFQHGPDLLDAGAHKFWPYVYYWAPGTTTINWRVPLPPKMPLSGHFYAYYAQLSSEAEELAPVTAACLAFEDQLGSGDEYTSPKDFSAQQIVYPEYAGVGASEIDLGAAGLIPQINLEVKGSFARWHPRGDCDFADIIEDVVKSGLMQTGAELGLIQRGANCNDLPGTVDKVYADGADISGTRQLTLSQPVGKGQLIFVLADWAGNGMSGDSVAVSDSTGQTWLPLTVLSTGLGFWYAVANADLVPGTVITVTSSEGEENARSMAWVLDPSCTGVDGAAAYDAVPSGTASVSIATAGDNDYLIAWVDTFVPPNPAAAPLGWSPLFPNAFTANGSKIQPFFRKVAAAGTYSFQWQGGAIACVVGIVAVKCTPAGQAPYPKALGNILDKSSLDAVRAQCQAAGLIGSLVMNSQRKASDWLKDLYDVANADPLWSGFVLKSIAKSEQSGVGNGCVFTAPTANGPVATLKESDLVATPDGPMITVSRKAQTNTDNTIQAQFYDRNSDYNPSSASEPLGGAVAILGPRKQGPQSWPMIQDPAVARMLLAIQARRWSLLRNTFKFTAKPNYFWLEGGDLVAVNDSKLGISNLALKLTSTAEQDDGSIACEADLFVYGCNAPNPGLTVTESGLGYSAGDGGDPGSVNAPIFIEAVPRLSGQGNQEELWIAVSAPSPNHGGCVVVISTDGGASYKPAVGKNGQNGIQGSAVTGVTTADWPAANDPDTANDLAIDLTESLGELDTFAAVDRDNFVYPCYVAGGGSSAIPYELMTYDIATLTSANKYTLQATGGGTNDLRRGVFGAPGPTPGAGVDHPTGSRFAFLDPSGIGIFKIAVDPSWIGKTIFFKFLAFNNLGNNLQDQSAATAYSFTPTGAAGATQNPNNQSYSITGGALTQPTATAIDMAQATAQFPSNAANYNARAFTISAPSSPTTYYITIYDPAQLGDTGSSANLTAFADANTTRWNTPGYIRIGSIVVQPGGGGSGGGVGVGDITVTVNGA